MIWLILKNNNQHIKVFRADVNQYFNEVDIRSFQFYNRRNLFLNEV